MRRNQNYNFGENTNNATSSAYFNASAPPPPTAPQPSAPNIQSNYYEPQVTTATSTTGNSSTYEYGGYYDTSTSTMNAHIPVATPVYPDSTANTTSIYSSMMTSPIPSTTLTYSSNTGPDHGNNPSQVSANCESGGSGGTRHQDGRKWGSYIGARNWRGQRHGYGTITYDDGSLYIGSWHNNEKHGKGTLLYSSGPKLEGYWQNNFIHGSGTYYYPDGRVDLRKYRRDDCVGEGVQFSADRQETYLLNCGRRKRRIDVNHAIRIASRLRLPFPM